MVAVLPIMAEQELTEVMVVSAKRLPTDSDRFSGSFSVITAEQIERRQYRVLGDALKDVPGVATVVSGGIGAQTSVFIRGSESDHVLILIDGVEVSDPAAGNRYEFSQLSLNGVERIEVLRGNYSAEYGSEALGGIINIITRSPTESNIAARIETGSFDRQAATIDIDAVYDRFDFSLSGRHFDTEGEDFAPLRIRRLAPCTSNEERDGYRNSNAKVNAGWLLIPETNTKMTVKSQYSQVDLEYDNSNTCNNNLRQSSYTKRTTIAMSGDYFGGIWSPTWRMDYYQRDSRDTGSAKRTGERFKLNWHNVWQPHRDLNAAFGIETELEQLRRDDGFDADARNNAFYGELRYALTSDWYVNFGWRNDDSDDFASERSYQFGSVLHAGLNTRLHINYATAFRAPSLTDRFEDFPAFNFYANSDLRPETSRGWEVGIEQTWSQWRYGLTYFNNDIDDLIVPSGSTLINQRQANIRGLESFIFFQPNKTLNMRLDYTLTSAHDQDNRRLERRPVRQALLTIDYASDHGMLAGWNFGVTFNYRGSQRENFGRTTFVPINKGGYTLANINLNYTVNEHLTLYAGINNLFDKSYEPVDGYSGNGLDAHIGLSLR